MNPVELVVGEGLLDARAAGKILRTLGVPFDPARSSPSLARAIRTIQAATSL